MVITREDAEVMFAADVAWACAAVDRACKDVTTSQDQFDAMVCLRVRGERQPEREAGAVAELPHAEGGEPGEDDRAAHQREQRPRAAVVGGAIEHHRGDPCQ